jgi:hypothetical protein
MVQEAGQNEAKCDSCGPIYVLAYESEGLPLRVFDIPQVTWSSKATRSAGWIKGLNVSD